MTRRDHDFHPIDGLRAGARRSQGKEFAMRSCAGLLAVALSLVSCVMIAAGAAAAAEKKKDDAKSKKQQKEWKVPARAARRANPVAADEKSIAAGKKLYIQECLDCHGDKGRGDGAGARDLDVPMPDLSDPKVLKQTDGSLFFKITEGREPMPGTEELSDEQRWHLVNYVRTLAPKPRDDSDAGAGAGGGDDAQAAKGK
jgi:mono/diheme cytochrome c family protein